MFFYDRQLRLFINDSPLLISSKVIEAAQSIGAAITWDCEGHVCGVSHDASLGLAEKLGSKTLSVKLFMHLARREPRVMSNRFAEWLTDTYVAKNDVMLDAKDRVVYASRARPGWFDLNDIDDNGLPTKFIKHNAPNQWKFWTLEDTTITTGAMRSFVTSSGTCSLDLGIPTFARHPMVMIREAYPGEPPVSSVPLDRIWGEYQKLVLQQVRDDAALESFLQKLGEDQLQVHNSCDEFLVEKRREMAYDLKGKRKLLREHGGQLKIIDYDWLVSLISTPVDVATTVVIGHPHPDADCIVSAVFEAARRTLLSPQTPCIAYAETIPPEVAHMLGPVLTSLVRTRELREDHEIVLVDCHSSPCVRTNLIKAVIDHHPIDQTFPYYVAQSQEISWSSTLQVYFKLLGAGYDLGPGAARLLADATMLEAEPDLFQQMSKTDRLAMSRLLAIATPQETSYADRMAIMTDVDDLAISFRKDYKESSFGFAVVKSRRCSDFTSQAQSNNIDRCLPLTVVKQVVYDETFSSVVTECICTVFNETFHDNGFTSSVTDVILRACQAFHGLEKVTSCHNTVYIANGKVQIPRLLLMPLIQQIVNEHLCFAFSKQLGRFVACGFFDGQGSAQLYGTTPGSRSVTSCICWNDVKALLSERTSTSFLSLSEYWTVYHELAHLDHVRSSLTDNTYVELLDTEFINGDQKRCTVIDKGVQRETFLACATPAQLRPQDIGTHGLPERLISPNVYDDPTLWRYWSPDATHNVATRGHIFLLNRPCIDLKISPEERTQRLTFRPIYRTIPDIKYRIIPDGAKWIKLEVYPRLFSIRD